MPTQKQIDTVFINMAKQLATLSNCVSFKVGALIVVDGRPVIGGYNGTPAGYINCNEIFEPTFDRNAHIEFSTNYEIHAEMNCILYAGRNGIKIDNGTIYVTLHPCWQCAKNLIGSGISRIVYLDEYDNLSNRYLLHKFLSDNNVEICKLEECI